MKRNGALRMTFQCNQTWDALTPHQEHRHCKTCDKVVYDFSTMSEEDIFKLLRSSTTKCCARVPVSKLQPSKLQNESRPNLRWSRAVFAGLSLLMVPFAGEALAQTSPAAIHETPYPSSSARAAQQVHDSLIRRFRLFDAHSAEPIPFASVRLGDKVTTSDLDGWVSIQCEFDTVTVRIGAVGYKAETRLLDFRNHSHLQVILIPLEPIVLGEVIETKRRWNPFRKWF